MGLQQDIGFELARANAVQRRLQRLVAIRSLSPRLMPVATGVDRALYRITRGKVSVTATVVAFPTVMLTTTGARSGKPRVAPLAAIPVGDDLAVIGTSGGTGKTPGWVFNLRANGNASLSYKANVVQADVVASNGVIHVIDTVILPPM